VLLICGRDVAVDLAQKGQIRVTRHAGAHVHVPVAVDQRCLDDVLCLFAVATQVADVLGIPVGTVKSRVSRGLAAIDSAALREERQ
jgi:hypothetical protein